ncbi:O-antigen ligase family protein [Mariprofundus sp. KV]|uniref:O-antigen ligase family protein n=1 Tax=Mariprofundus sp. KV TaxID=2608715 RepID=UPI0015A4A671|nr:O-antigen ligase family protein [Mariprofundus sp. KV]
MAEKKYDLPAPLVAIFFFLLSTPFLIGSDLLLFSFALAAIYLYASLLPHHELKTVYKTFMVSVAIIISLALYVWVGLNGSEALHFYGWALTTDAIQNKMNGPFANGNVLAIVIVCAWSIAVWFWLNCSSRSQWGWLLIILFFWIFIFSSMARGAWLAQMFLLAWVMFELLRRKCFKKTVAILIAGFIAWSAGDALAQFNQPQIGGIQHQFEKSAEDGLAERVTLWRSAWEVWKSSPMLGVGPSQFKAHYLTAQSKALESTPDAHGIGDTASAHHILLHLMAEYGIAGFLLWVALSLFILRLLWLYRFKLDALRWPALASVVVLWIQGHFNISLTEPFPLTLFALMLGIVSKPLIQTHSFQIKKTWFLAVTFIVFAFLVSGAIQTTAAWHKFGQWVHMDYKAPQKGAIASVLANNDQLFPYIVEFSIAEMVHLPGKQRQIAEMRPLILRALSLHERPRLYRELFYAYIVDDKLVEACKTGMFIRRQNWITDEPNRKAYADVCRGKTPEAFQL